MPLYQAIGLCDPDDVSGLESVYEHYSDEEDFEQELVTCCNDRATEQGATWILKHFIEHGGELSESSTDALITRLPSFKHWQSCLHVLQLLDEWNISETQVDILFHFLRHKIQDDNKFVRAWSYNGLHVIATQYNAYFSEVESLLKIANEDEASSVKARIRNIVKSGNYSI